MKRLFAVLLVLSCFLGLCGCEEVEKAVPSPLSWADIDAIPVASADMTEEQLRQVCLDFFRLQLTFQWTPKENFAYSIVTYKEPRSFSAGIVYAGLPYQGRSLAGNLYWAMEYYDEATGILNNSGMDGQTFSELLGNHCTSSPYWAWTRVVNSVTTYTNARMTESYGFLPVGDYEYDTREWSDLAQTKLVTQHNGEQRMYECYALLKPADGIFLYYSAGGNSHCRMICSYPEVVRNSDGTINGEESYVLFMDQGSGLKDYTAADGTVVQLQGKVDTKATFAELFSKSYVPFTFGEFVGSDPVEPGQVTLALPESATVSDLIGGNIVSNYPIACVQVTMKDTKGAVTYTLRQHSGGIEKYEMLLGKLLSLSEVKSRLEQSEQTMTVQVRISTGQLITAWEGKVTGN